MTTYIYFVKCPGCEDEHFDFFDEAKEFALGCLSQKPIITQTEIERNDFGECTDYCDLGTVWSWEDMMKETEAEPTKSIFTKDDLKCMANDQDPEFDNLDNSVDCGIEESELTEASPADAARAPKDSDYVIVLKNPMNNRHTFFGNNYRMTADLNKAMTYPGKFSAQDDIKYAADQSVQATNDPDDFYYENNFFVTTVAEAKKLLGKYEDRLQHKARLAERKPIPEGMTIEQIVEEMEENEDTVECTWCNDLFDKDQCRYEVNLGWLCSRCEMAIKSRGETLTFREGSYWDFLDEDITAERSIGELVRDSIKHLVKDLGKDSTAEDFADDVILDIERNYDNFVPEDPMNHMKWASAIASEVSRQLNNPDKLTEGYSWLKAGDRFVLATDKGNEHYLVITTYDKETEKHLDKYERYVQVAKENSDGKFTDPFDIEYAVLADYKNKGKLLFESAEYPKEIHDLGNTYDGGYPTETPEISNSHLKFCPECGTENTFDIETGVCLKCGFIV